MLILKMQTVKKLLDSPIIGIAVVMSDQETLGKYCLPASYVKNIESSGARVAPIFPNQSTEYYQKMFSGLNGFFIPGGPGAPLQYQRPITDVVKLFYDWSISSFDRGVYWPIWGTCLGFEMLTTITAGMVDCLDHCHCQSGSRRLELKSGYQDSRLIKGLPKDLLQAISVEPLFPHAHTYCVTLENFAKYNLHKFYRIIGTNKDKLGMEYVTAIEALNYPIYAVMSHQEKPIFQWNPKYPLNRSSEAIRLGQAFMNFFVQECCKNNNRFSSINLEHAALIQNYSPKFTAPLGCIADECYYF